MAQSGAAWPVRSMDIPTAAPWAIPVTGPPCHAADITTSTAKIRPREMFSYSRSGASAARQAHSRAVVPMSRACCPGLSTVRPVKGASAPWKAHTAPAVRATSRVK